MSSKIITEANGYHGHNLEFLVILHYLRCASYRTRRHVWYLKAIHVVSPVNL